MKSETNRLEKTKNNRTLCPMFDLKTYMIERADWINQALDRTLPPPMEHPTGLHEAMRYSLFIGGKRIRPILCMAAAEAVGGTAEAALPIGAALECLHTYSLIHDDLPAMDDDDLRRGQPTLHKVYGEANAILAGDSLLTLAFEILAQQPQGAQLSLELAQAAGSRGLAGGQFEDLAEERQAQNREHLMRIHANKTGKLIRAACRMGGISANATATQLEALGRYGEAIGLAFQIADDILNVTSTQEVLGKSVGSDARREKITYVACIGIEAAQAEARELVKQAITALNALPGDTEPLQALAHYVVDRLM